MGHRKNVRRIRAGALGAAEILENRLILTFQDGTQKSIREKHWHHYRIFEVLKLLDEDGMDAMLR